MAGDAEAALAEAARRLSALMLERYEARYGVPAGRAEAARLEAEFLSRNNRMAPLGLILRDLESFKAEFPEEWSRRKPWLNPPRSHEARMRALLGLVSDLPKAWRRALAQGPQPVQAQPPVAAPDPGATTVPAAPTPP